MTSFPFSIVEHPFFGILHRPVIEVHGLLPPLPQASCDDANEGRPREGHREGLRDDCRAGKNVDVRGVAVVPRSPVVPGHLDAVRRSEPRGWRA